MTKTLTKKMDVAGKKSAEASETNDSSQPVWTAQHGRVRGAMWTHPQDDGKTRVTVSISRSYKDKDSEEWQNVHYFDEQDLKDVRTIVSAAEEKALDAKGMSESANEE